MEKNTSVIIVIFLIALLASIVFNIYLYSNNIQLNENIEGLEDRNNMLNEDLNRAEMNSVQNICKFESDGICPKSCVDPDC